MRRTLICIIVLMARVISDIFSQAKNDVSVYLLTCGPGTETYSIYGHCALRIINPGKNSDLVYNWGVFDFDTPNFAWKFAKGRLDYMLATTSFDNFLREYFYEQRWVQSQKINLEPEEINIILSMVEENLKPENAKYRYDFFYDNCATRIRDLLEKSIGKKLVYPPEPKNESITFRAKINKYERPYPWLRFGTDLLIGTPAEKKVTFRDKMFLPLDMKQGLSDIVVNRNGRMIPLLQNPETVVDFGNPAVKPSFFSGPNFIFSLFLILIILFFALVKNKNSKRIADLVIFAIFSILALLILFFNFFTDHIQCRNNLNIIWLSPFILVCLAALIFRKNWVTWYRIVFFLCILSLVIQLVFPGGFNNAFIPLLLTLLLRSSARSDFSWNPLTVEPF